MPPQLAAFLFVLRLWRLPARSEHETTKFSHSETVVRAATIEDYTALCALFIELDAFHRAARPDLFVPPPDPPRSLEYVQSFISGNDSAVFVAEQSRAVVGFITVKSEHRPATPVRPARVHAEVDSLVVASASRRSGIGKLLVKRAETWSLERGATRLLIGVFAFNRSARRFYRKVGYEPQTLMLARSLR